MKPVDPLIAERMRALGRAIADAVPEEHGFVLFTFDRRAGGMATYVSNAHFQDVLRALKAFIEKVESERTRDKTLS